MSSKEEYYLYHACWAGKKDEVMRLLGKGVKPYYYQSDGKTCLHFACKHGWSDVVMQLIEEHGCSQLIKDCDKRTPVYYAREGGHSHIVRYLSGKPGKHYNSEYNDMRVSRLLSTPVSKLTYQPQQVVKVTPVPQLSKIKQRTQAIPYCSTSDQTAPRHPTSEQTARRCPTSDQTAPRHPVVHTTCVAKKAVYCDLSSKTVVSQKPTVDRLRSEFKISANVSSKQLLELMHKHESEEDKVISIVKAFVNNDPNQITTDGDTVLHLVCYPPSYFKHSCCSDINISIIQFLFSQCYRCNPNVENNRGMTPLELTSNFRVMEELIRHGATTTKNDIFKLVSKTRFKEYGERRVVSLLQMSLYNTKWTPNDMDGDGNTVLHLACRTNDIEIVLVLLSAKLNVEWNLDAQNNDGKTPLDLTSTHTIMIMLIKHGAGMSSERLQHVINNCNANEIFEILRGFLCENPDRKTFNGDTILHIVSNDSKWDHSHPCRMEVIHFLLDSTKCNPNIEDQMGITPIQLTSSFEVMSELIKYDATTTKYTVFKLVSSPNIKCELINSAIHKTNWSFCDTNLDGDTALHIACKVNNFDGVKCLLRAEVDSRINNQCQQPYESSSHPKFMTMPPVSSIMMSNFAGKTPLQLTSDFQIMKELIEHGATITADDIFKLASNSVHASNEYEVVELLKCSKSHQKIKWNHTDKDADGNTALHIACKHNQPAFVHFLLSDAKCDCKVNNDAGRSPLQLTTHLGIMKELIQHDAKMTPDVVSNIVSNSPPAMEHEAVEVLQLSKECCDQKFTYNCGNTLLHLACISNRPAVVHFLLSEIHFDPNVKNDAGKTPLDLTTDKEISADLFRYCAKTSDPRHLYHVHKALGTRKPLLPAVKVFIVGDSDVGKSELTDALQQELHFPLRLFSSRVSGVQKNKTGFIPYEFNSKSYGRVILHDFAGQKEFYRGHIALLQSEPQVSAPVFVIVADLRDDGCTIGKKITVWLSFLNNHISSEFKPHVIIVGSHADVLKIENQDPYEKAKLVYSSLHRQYPMIVDFIAMDCQHSDSREITRLRQSLKKCCDEVRTHLPESITPNAHCFYVYLLNNFSEKTAISLGSIQEHIEKQHRIVKEDRALYYLPVSIKVLHKICNELNDRGHILFLEDRNNYEKNWIVIKKTVLLSEVIGTIFAPTLYRPIASNTGVVPLSKITELEHFSEQNPEMLVRFLSHFEFCHTITDLELIATINNLKEYSQDECYLLCPALISQEAPTDLWEPNPNLSYKFGWILKCTDSTQHFSSRFLQVLLLRMAFSFPLVKQPNEVESSYPGIHRKCSIWKNGIFWGSRFGTQTLVELTDSNKVVVRQRFEEKYCVRTSYLRSQVIQKIFQCMKEFCSNIETTELFIPSTSVWYSQIPSTMKTFTVQEVVANLTLTELPAYGVSETGGTEPFQNLLIAEPYVELKVTVFKDLYSAQNDEIAISDKFIGNFAQQVSKEAINFFKQMLKFVPNKKDEVLKYKVSDRDSLIEELKAWRNGCKGTYQCLRQKFDQCSVFAGRTILECAVIRSGPMQSRVSTHLPEIEDDSSEYDLSPSQLPQPLRHRSSSPTFQPQPVASEHDFSKLPDVEHHHIDKITWKDENGWRRELHIYSKIAHKWDKIATRLGFIPGELKSIKKDHPYDSDRILTVLNEWYDNANNLPNATKYPKSWHGLINLLREAELGEVAEELCTALSSQQNSVKGNLPDR